MSIDFEPVKVGGARRRAEPLTIGILAVVIALAAAVIKPWEPVAVPAATRPPVAAAPASPTTSGVAPVPRATGRIVQRDPLRGAPPPTWALLESVIATHDSWGVRAIIVSWRGFQADPRPRYLEHWSRTEPAAFGDDVAVIARDSRSIVALGISYPPASVPKAVRWWRVHSNSEREEIDARPIGRGKAEGAFLYLRSNLAGTGVIAWDAGHYRIDVLVDGETHRIAVEVPEPLAVVPATDERAIS